MDSEMENEIMYFTVVYWARGSAVDVTIRKVANPILDGVIGIFY